MKWILFSLLLGAPLPNSPVFDTKSGCQLYLHTSMGDTVAESFKVICVEKP